MIDAIKQMVRHAMIWMLSEPDPPLRAYGWCSECKREVDAVPIRGVEWTEWICWHCDSTIGIVFINASDDDGGTIRIDGRMSSKEPTGKHGACRH